MQLLKKNHALKRKSAHKIVQGSGSQNVVSIQSPCLGSSITEKLGHGAQDILRRVLNRGAVGYLLTVD